MPNHWETSARPLFVKTVFVNGNRHAILFEKDPLLRCVTSPVKKTSRPNSSLSFASGLTISSSEESQKTSSECKTFKIKNIGRRQGKDLTSELQGCLVKFKLASNGVKDKNKQAEGRCFCDLRTDSKGDENSKQKTHRGNRDKSGKRCEEFRDEQGRKSGRDNSCYIYNLENYKRRKNYSFVKITSQSPQFILNCSCENDWNETHNTNPRRKNNLVISASIQNLVMTPNENENFIEKTFDYVFPFENSELNWNNYLTKSSLAERVFQWLDLARKRKKSLEKPTLSDADCDTSTERIYSGKKFADEIKKSEDLGRGAKKSSGCRKNGQMQSDASEEEIEEKVIRERNVETLLSREKNVQECSRITGDFGETQQLNNPKNLSDSSIYNVIKTPFKIQDLFVNPPTSENESFGHESVSKIREELSGRNAAGDQVVVEEKPEKHLRCYCTRDLDKRGDDINVQTLTEEFAERNQKSINNLNITRTRPVLIQNLSPQQHDKISSSLDEENIVWASEKSTGRPQLHIFMPSVLLRDQSDDSMSECETFLNS